MGGDAPSKNRLYCALVVQEGLRLSDCLCRNTITANECELARLYSIDLVTCVHRNSANSGIMDTFIVFQSEKIYGELAPASFRSGSTTARAKRPSKGQLILSWWRKSQTNEHDQRKGNQSSILRHSLMNSRQSPNSKKANWTNSQNGYLLK